VNKSSSKKTQPSEPAVLIYTKSIETYSGSKDIQLYWGSIASIVDPDAHTVISSTVFQGNFSERKVMNLGAAWSALDRKFEIGTGYLSKVVLSASEHSDVWPISEKLKQKIDRYGTTALPYLGCIPTNLTSKKNIPSELYCLHTYPLDKGSAEEDYQHALNAVPLGIQLNESRKQLADEHYTPASTLVLSALSARQTLHPAEVLAPLMTSVEGWFALLPDVQQLKICYWDAKVERDLEQKLASKEVLQGEDYALEIRRQLIERIGDKVFEGDKITNSIILAELRKKLTSTLKSYEGPQEVVSSLQNLNVVIHRDNMTIIELGSASGRVTEGLVNDLHYKFYGTRSSDFYSGIERLAEKPPTETGYAGIKLAPWYKSYLHTMRILRNQSAHSQLEENKTFPNTIEVSDMWVLMSNLYRILELHMNLGKRDGLGSDA